jgi:hypothetical protein
MYVRMENSLVFYLIVLIEFAFKLDRSFLLVSIFRSLFARARELTEPSSSLSSFFS